MYFSLADKILKHEKQKPTMRHIQIKTLRPSVLFFDYRKDEGVTVEGNDI